MVRLNREEKLKRKRESQRRYFAKNKDKINAKRRACHAKNPERFREQHQKWYRKYREREILKLRERQHVLRKAVMKKLGNKCVRCGFSDWRALQIDHIDGGGNKEKKEIGQDKMYRRILTMDEKKLVNHYQILCANCNWIKKHEMQETVGHNLEGTRTSKFIQ